MVVKSPARVFFLHLYLNSSISARFQVGKPSALSHTENRNEQGKEKKKTRQLVRLWKFCYSYLLPSTLGENKYQVSVFVVVYASLIHVKNTNNRTNATLPGECIVIMTERCIID